MRDKNVIRRTASARGKPDSFGYKMFVLFLLFLYFTLNFIDRQIVGILALPIKAELASSDPQLGLLGGIAFAIFYSVVAVPVALLSDRSRRTWIITAAIALWSLFTILCGSAGSFAQLFLCRLGVGVGEAGGTAPIYSLISDYFPRAQRGRALSIFFLGLPVGSAIGIGLGGVVAAEYGWRSAFFLVGALGIVLTPLIWFSVPEPPCGGMDREDRAEMAVPFLTCIRLLASKPAFWFLSLGMSSGAILLYGFGFWLPSFMKRSHGLSLRDTSVFLGSIVLIGGILGNALGGWLGDRLGSLRQPTTPLSPVPPSWRPCPSSWARSGPRVLSSLSRS